MPDIPTSEPQRTQYYQELLKQRRREHGIPEDGNPQVRDYGLQVRGEDKRQQIPLSVRNDKESWERVLEASRGWLKQEIERVTAKLDELGPADLNPPTYECAKCKDTGFIDRRIDGRWHAFMCECRPRRRAAVLLKQACIPENFSDPTLDNFTTDPSCPSYRSLAGAKLAVQELVEHYPLERRGLLLSGPCGTGKTHLAAAAIKALISAKGARCLFQVWGELLTSIRNTYSRESGESELDLLDPVFSADVLVLDEVGATKTTEWNLNVVYEILNRRYNAQKTTIITSNFPLSAPHAEGLRAAMRPETLGDRIGERAVSRLHEMCRLVEVSGPDWRKNR